VKFKADFKILSNTRLSEDYFVLNLLSEKKINDIKPGQFVQVLVENSVKTFLRRPFSIHDVDYEKNTIKLYIKIVGEGTKKLCELKEGSLINIIYPLGNSFSIPENKNTLLIGGGCGIAPLLFLAKTLDKNNNRVTTLLGGKCKTDIFEISKYFKPDNIYFTTEDSTFGETGFVTNHSLLRGTEFKADFIYSYGPEPMLKSIAEYAKSRNAECEVSLENTMACGFGVCLCCVVDTISGNQCVCSEGPVFNINSLKW
jgi:dihydroorotate dehydrogenase electron transfer subunit